MTARFANETEIENWDDLIIANPDRGNVFAGYDFAMQKETGGYSARFIILDKLAVTVLEKNTPPLGKFWYLPKGPEVTGLEDLWKVLDEIEPLAKQHGVFAIRIEPELDRKYQAGLEKKRFAQG